MKQKLIDLLESFGFPVFLQGSMNEGDNYPPSFFTFWNFDTPEDSHYNNAPSRAVWGFWVYFYSDDPGIVDQKLADAAALLRGAGWIVDGKGKDVASDEPTHTGRMIVCQFIENY